MPLCQAPYSSKRKQEAEAVTGGPEKTTQLERQATGASDGLTGASRPAIAGGDLKQFNTVLSRREQSHKKNYWYH